jgi:hypothetical protein
MEHSSVDSRSKGLKVSSTERVNKNVFTAQETMQYAEKVVKHTSGRNTTRPQTDEKI